MSNSDAPPPVRKWDLDSFQELLREKGILYPPFLSEDVYLGSTTAFLLFDSARSTSYPGASKKIILTGHASHASESSDTEWSNYVRVVGDWITARKDVRGTFVQSHGWDPGLAQLGSLTTVYKSWSKRLPAPSSGFEFPKVRVLRKSNAIADRTIGFFATMLNVSVFNGKEFIGAVRDAGAAAKDFGLSENETSSFLTTVECLMRTLVRN